MNTMYLTLENEILQDTLEIKDLYIECMNLEYSCMINEDNDNANNSFKEKMKKFISRIIETCKKILNWIKIKILTFAKKFISYLRLFLEKLKNIKSKKNEAVDLDIPKFRFLDIEVYKSIIIDISNFESTLSGYTLNPDLDGYFSKYVEPSYNGRIKTNYIDKSIGSICIDNTKTYEGLNYISILDAQLKDAENLTSKFTKHIEKIQKSIEESNKEFEKVSNELNRLKDDNDVREYIKKVSENKSLMEMYRTRVLTKEQAILYSNNILHLLASISKVSFA